MSDESGAVARPGQPVFQVHRLTTGRMVAWAVVAAALIVLVDASRRHALGASSGALLVLLAICLVAYVLGFRPAVAESPTGLEVRNPLRTTDVPWGAVADVVVTDVVCLHTTGGVVRCFALPRRRPSPGVRGPSAQTYGFTLPDQEPDRLGAPRPGVPRAQAVAERFLELARRFQATSAGDPAVRIAPDAVAALVAAVVAALLAFVVIVL